MTFVRGKWIHHNDCTYCLYRLSVPYKEGKKNRSYELCQFHKRRCAPVNDLLRYCEAYRQINCQCERCTQKDLTNVA